MSNPPTARPFDQALDPSDCVDFYVYLAQGAPDAQVAPLLLLGEAVGSYSLGLTAEAVAAGLQIRNDGAYAPVLTGNELAVWLRVDAAKQGSSLFDDQGIVVGIVLTFTTTANPARTKQRTYLVRIANQ